MQERLLVQVRTLQEGPAGGVQCGGFRGNPGHEGNMRLRDYHPTSASDEGE
jgi:hypothetical protein